LGLNGCYERKADLAVNLTSVIISGLSAIHRNMVCPDFHWAMERHESTIYVQLP